MFGYLPAVEHRWCSAHVELRYEQPEPAGQTPGAQGPGTLVVSLEIPGIVVSLEIPGIVVSLVIPYFQPIFS